MSKTTKKADQRRALVELGARIQRHRHAAKKTQAELAKDLNLSVAYISLIERGGRNPPVTTVLALARALGVSPGVLVE